MNRKKPYSGAKKKKQLQEKRAKQRGELPPEGIVSSEIIPSSDSFSSANQKNTTKDERASKKWVRKTKRLDGLSIVLIFFSLRTIFEKETKEEIEARKLLAMQPIIRNSKNVSLKTLSFRTD